MKKSKLLRHAVEYRRFVREWARASSKIPIRVIDGNSEPTESGDGYRWETKTGFPFDTLAHTPRSVVEYVLPREHDPGRGRAWSARQACIPICAMRPSNTAEHSRLCGFRGPTARGAGHSELRGKYRIRIYNSVPTFAPDPAAVAQRGFAALARIAVEESVLPFAADF